MSAWTMHAGYTIHLATAAHVAALPGIESEAAARFAGWQVPRAVLTETTPFPALTAAQATGQLWVALSRSGDPVGFGLVEALGTRLHLEELDVLPDHGGRGIGTALVARSNDGLVSTASGRSRSQPFATYRGTHRSTGDLATRSSTSPTSTPSFSGGWRTTARVASTRRGG